MEEIVTRISSLSTDQIIPGIFLLCGCFLAAHYIRKVVMNLVGASSVIPKGMQPMINSILRWVLDGMAVMITANFWGIPINAFLSLVTVIGLALSMAFQGILGNAIGGAVILASKIFVPGEIIEVEPIIGRVKDISIMRTRIDLFDGRTAIIPNKDLYTQQIINYHTHGTVRMECSICAGYNNPPDKVRAACLDAVHKVKGIMANPEPMVRLVNYGDSNIDYKVLFWCSPDERNLIKFALNEELFYSFQRHNISIEFPHIELHRIN
ncbi:MAG: mechanosensitive ion channel family protein [Clostridia bacterium]|nr:mechanosensitive ion channel family protein [Clostridia bacterium]